MEFLSEAQWEQYARDGYLVLDKAATEAEVAQLNQRLNAIMLGEVQYGDSLIMQLDPSATKVAEGGGGSSSAATKVAEGGGGAGGGSTLKTAPPTNESHARALYSSLNTAYQTPGFKGPSLAYRKVGEAQGGLEVDDVFLAFMRKPLFRHICGRVYGAHAGVGVYRAMVMSKPENDLGGGTPLPWHQDGGNWWALDRDPLCFVWLALTPATAANGAVELVRGSHRLGLLSRRGHTLSPEHVAALVEGAPAEDRVVVELQPGQAFLCHNWTIHRSSINTTGTARRGFSCNYIDARTRVLCPKPSDAGDLGKAGEGFPTVWEAQYP